MYNIIEDPFYRNLPNEIRGGERILSMRPPLGINLYYMLTPFSSSVEGRESLEDIQAHTLIAKAIRGFNENAVVESEVFSVKYCVREVTGKNISCSDELGRNYKNLGVF